jgi:hypothetical protein
MKNTIATILAAGALALAGCSTPYQQQSKLEYKTVSSSSDEVLNTPVAQGWRPISFSVMPDGNKYFLLEKAKTRHHPGRWEYKTVSSSSDEVLNTPIAQGWTVVNFCVMANGNKYFLLKKEKV